MTQLRLEAGDRLYLGYHEWAVHPDEAAVILERGWVSINGVRLGVRQMDLINGEYPLIRVAELEEYGSASEPQCPALDALTETATLRLVA